MSAGADPTAKVSLRAALPDDVQSMAEIEREAFSDPWPASAFRELLGHTHVTMMVAVDAAQLVCGYCVVLRVLDEGEIANIAVAPAQRRRGIAADLLDRALADAARHHVRSVFLEVRVGNEAARGLYASRGFAPVGRRRAYYREPVEDALVLRWTAPAIPETGVHDPEK
jgi:ribosomal-protein-alanine N-acetyltransferase